MANAAENDQAKRQVANWLLLGAAMIVIQVLLGGITRLTESGLSITEWKPVTGTLPPLNQTEWQAEFDKYKNTDQFRYIHKDFSLTDFKFIFFWEWFHRLWARLLGMVFLTGFVYFIISKKLKREFIRPLVILFILGGLQGAIGWLMVKSGLVPQKYFVGHIELTVHLMMALLLLAYTLWFALKLKIPSKHWVINPPLQKLLLVITLVLFFQLIYGGFMAGMRTAVMAPTWPDINGYFFPDSLNSLPGTLNNAVNNPIALHFIHRSLAYFLFILVIIGWIKARKIKAGLLFRRLWLITMLTLTFQVILGVLTVLNSPYANRLIWLGAAHQFLGMILVILLTSLLFITRKKKPVRFLTEKV